MGSFVFQLGGGYGRGLNPSKFSGGAPFNPFTHPARYTL